MSDFEAHSEWSNLEEGFDHARNDKTILLDRFFLPTDECTNLVEGIKNGTASIVSDGSFKQNSPIGPAGTSSVILAPSTSSHKQHWVRGENWVTVPVESQSPYRSKLAGVIAGLTVVDILVRHHKITEGGVTLALDGLTAMEECAGDWPLSIDQKCFDYLQVIWAWIKLSPLTITFRHVKGHQTDFVSYEELDWWGKRNEDVDEYAKGFLRTCTSGLRTTRKSHVQPTLYLEKWVLSRDGSKFTSICRESLYTNLYGSRTLAYWAEKDNLPTDPKLILWKESRLAMKRLSRGQRRIDSKLLCNSCGFENTLFNRREQNTHTCPVCNGPNEDRDHMLTCQAPSAIANRKKNFDSLEKEMKDLETSPTIAKAIIGICNHVQNGTTPTTREYGHVDFGRGITLRNIIKDQARIGWTNFLCGRWGVKWKEAQRRHYISMNKKKSARLWIIAILKKLILIRNDLWQFRNAAKHSPTGITITASHHSLNYRISEEITIGTDGIDRSNYHLFKSKKYAITKLHSSSIPNKRLWLREVELARKEYVEPDNAVTRQAIAQRKVMQIFLSIAEPLMPTTPTKRPIATQDNHITEEAQKAATKRFFPCSLRQRKRRKTVATDTCILLQRKLREYANLF